MRLREYQGEAKSAVFSEWNRVNTTMVLMATGCGKTVLFAHVAAERPGVVIVVAHRDELITQAADKIAAVTKEHPWIEKAEQTVENQGMYTDSHIIVTSMQSMCKPKRIKRVKEWAGFRGGVRTMITDECHHYTINSRYKAIADEFRDGAPEWKELGVTATRRSDEVALGQVFESCAYTYDIRKGIDEGYLCPIHQEMVHVEGLDFSTLRSKKNALGESDLDPKALEAILLEEKNLHEVARSTIERVVDRPSLVFCANVNHAKAMSMILNRYRKDCSAFVHGGTPTDERKRLIQRYQDGDIQFLTNCGVFTEGFDAPATAAVVMARPTKSLTLYTQIVGRGTRPLPGLVDALGTPIERKAAIANSEKPNALVLDFVGNAGRHKLISCVDVLGGRFEEDLRLYANGLLGSTGGNVEAALQMAEVEMQLNKEMKAFARDRDRVEKALQEEISVWQFSQQRKQVVADAVHFRTRSVDPFNAHQTGTHVDTPKAQSEPPTPAMIWRLTQMGYSHAEAKSFSRRKAGVLIGGNIKKGGDDAKN